MGALSPSPANTPDQQLEHAVDYFSQDPKEVVCPPGSLLGANPGRAVLLGARTLLVTRSWIPRPFAGDGTVPWGDVVDNVFCMSPHHRRTRGCMSRLKGSMKHLGGLTIWVCSSNRDTSPAGPPGRREIDQNPSGKGVPL